MSFFIRNKNDNIIQVNSSLDVILKVRNESGNTINIGTPIYLSGHNNTLDIPLIDVANASNSSKMPCIGVSQEQISSGSNGNIMQLGKLIYDTSSLGFNLGETLYVSTIGTLSNNEPTGSDFNSQIIGVMGYNNSTNGFIIVNTVGSELNAFNAFEILLESLESNIGTIGSNVLTLESNINVIETDINVINYNIGILYDYVYTFESNIIVLESNISVLESNVEAIEFNINTIEYTLTDLINTDSIIFSNITTLEGNISVLEGNINVLEGNINVLEGNISVLEGNVTSLSSNVSNIVLLNSNLDISSYGNINLNTTTGKTYIYDDLYINKNIDVIGNLSIIGNLSVIGTTTTVNSNITVIQDPVIELGVSDINETLFDRGIKGNWYDGGNQTLFFGMERDSKKFKYIPYATFDSSTGNIVASGEPGSAEFGNIFLNDNTESYSISTGTLISNGGAGITSNLYVGGNVFVSKELYINDISITSRFNSLESNVSNIVLSNGNLDISSYGNINLNTTNGTLYIDGTEYTSGGGGSSSGNINLNLDDGNIYIGNGDNTNQYAITGDITLSNTGVTELISISNTTTINSSANLNFENTKGVLFNNLLNNYGNINYSTSNTLIIKNNSIEEVQLFITQLQTIVINDNTNSLLPQFKQPKLSAIYNDYLLICSPLDDDNGTRSGAVYIFKNNGSNSFTQLQKLTASDGNAYDYFGSSVNIYGDYIVIGSYNDDDNGTNSGSAYIFKNNGSDSFTQLQKLIANDGESSDYFGKSVTIYGDYIVISSYLDDDNGTNSGSAYIFKNNGSDSFTQLQKLTANDGSYYDVFGDTVSIYGDYIVISSYYDDDNGTNSGSAYIFKNNGSDTFTQLHKLTASDGDASYYFGSSLSIYNDYIVISSYDFLNVGSVYIFKNNGSDSFTQQQKIITNSSANDYFGYSVDMYGDYIIASKPYDDTNGINSGSVYVFKNNGSDSFTQEMKLTDTNGSAYDYYGYSVSIYSNTIAICNSKVSKIFVYDINTVYNYNDINIEATGNINLSNNVIISNTFTLSQSNIWSNLSGQNTITIDFNQGSDFYLTLSSGANITLNSPINVNRIGQQGSIIFKTPSSGSTHELNWESSGSWYFPGAFPPQLSLDNNAIDVFSYLVVENNIIVVNDAVNFQQY